MRLPRPIAYTSRKPLVVMSAVRAPLRSSTVLIATVEPCSTSDKFAASTFARSIVSATPCVGSAGTVDALDVTIRPSMQPTRSVKVPPISTPTRFINSPGDARRSVFPTREAALDGPDDLIQSDGHQGKNSYQSEERRRVECLGEEFGEIADSRRGHIELCEDDAEQCHGHRQAKAGEEARHHMGERHIADDIAPARAHGSGCIEKKRVHVPHAGHDVDQDREHAMAKAEGDLGCRPDAEAESKQWQQNDLRNGIEQKDDWKQAAAAQI